MRCCQDSGSSMTDEDKGREATALELIPGLVGSPIYREAP